MARSIEIIEDEEYELPEIELPEEDGVPLESNWHRAQINLLIDNTKYRWPDRQDFFAGGNMFIYYSLQQARNKDYKGPDFFVIKGVDGSLQRRKWVAWEEDGRLPHVIVELMSPSTARQDLTSKKTLYQDVFRTAEYFAYNPESLRLYGWRLQEGGVYAEIATNPQGRIWSSELQAWIGPWSGEYLRQRDIWLRLFDESGQLIPIEAEAERQKVDAQRQRADAEQQRADAEQQRAEAERQRAETERQRAETAEAEIALLRAALAERTAA